MGDLNKFEDKIETLNLLFGELSALPQEEIAEYGEDLIKMLASLDLLIHTVSQQSGETKDQILSLMQNIKAIKGYGGK